MLRWLDSADHYTTMLDKYDGWFNASIAAGGGRFGDNAILFGNADHYVEKVFDAQPTWIAGMSWYANHNTFGDGQPMFILYDGGSKQVDIRHIQAGTLCQFRATRNGTTLGTSTFALRQLRSYYLEIKVTIDNTVGVVEIKVDGTTILNLTGIDTQATGNASADSVRWGGDGGSTRSLHVSDIYLLDGTGSAPNNTFWGDTRVQAIFPNGNGNSSQFVGSDADSTDNYLLVDEITPNSDTDYVESSTVTDKDTYAFGNVAATAGPVNGLQILPFARKTDAGVREIASVARLGTTEDDSADETLATSYAYYPDIRELDPDGNPWTISNVNASEFGVKVTT